MEIFEHQLFWIFLIGSSLFSVFRTRWTVNKHIKSNPSLKQGYNQYLIWSLLFYIPPLTLLAYSNLNGITDGFIDFFRYDSEIWTVQLMFAYLISVQIFITWWMYFYNGAAFYIKHTGLQEYTFFGYGKTPTVKSIKIVYALRLFIFIGFIAVSIHFDLFEKFFPELTNP